MALRLLGTVVLLPCVASLHANVQHTSLPGATRRDTLAAALFAVGSAGLPSSADAATLPREIMTSVPIPAGKDGKAIEINRRRFTGAGDPAWTYPVKDVSRFILDKPFPDKWPYVAADFKRLDEEPDLKFYRPYQPKLVYHIDEGAVASLTHYYETSIASGSDILDICSSWVSHFPRDFPTKMKSIVGTGINQIELGCNDRERAQKQIHCTPLRGCGCVLYR